MRILHIINNLGPGGAEKLIEELSPAINNLAGTSLDILVLSKDNNIYYDSLSSKGIKVDIIRSQSIYSPLHILKINTYINKGNYDIVHSHLFPTQYWVGLSRIFSNSKKVKYVTTEHSTNNRRRNKPYFRLMDKYIYSKYDSVISITDNTRKNLVNWIKPKDRELNRYKVIENGINIDKFINAAPYSKNKIKEEFSEQTKLICMVGRFEKAKDQATLIRAMKVLSSEIHLLLVGEGALKGNNMSLAKELGVSNRVHFLGFRNDIPNVLKTVDIVILSSYWEGLSLFSIEGMACGKPFIATKVQGLEEIVGGYGLLFRQGDVKGLCLLINKLLSDRIFYKEVSERCITRSRTYDLRNTVEKLVQLYRNL
ncbi:glycosyltransferase [Bacillus mangrovi]|uniref:Glycosyltransferase n=1 Tax=Metabacillus mangrovi TaxID=1491830 RepID=A0A7X2V577_9BACI|nr:glycosyltransferase [Metabacillus mangrovi]MTH54507.1 glycosyltransferase [Metabacillus mangrovi]